MIPITKPDVSFDEVSSEIADILSSGQLTSGKYVREFERIFAEYIGVKYAFATTSATTALHMSLIAADIGVGDEVLVADFTFPASGNTIVQSGATPILVDCCSDSFLLDLEHAEKLVSKNTKAIMPVATFGQSLDMVAVENFARRHDLFLLEDAACSLGAHWQGRSSGSMIGAACFSFHPRKIITTGEGGMITTDDDLLAERLQLLRTHGGKIEGEGTVGLSFHEFGYNYRMSEIQAALGIAQMKRLDAIIEDRRRVAKLYNKALADINTIRCPQEVDGSAGTYQSYVILLDKIINRNQVISELRAAGIETTLGTYAMHMQPAYSKFNYEPTDLLNACRAQNQSLTLPLLPNMKNEMVKQVTDKLRETLLRAENTNE